METTGLSSSKCPTARFDETGIVSREGTVRYFVRTYAKTAASNASFEPKLGQNGGFECQKMSIIYGFLDHIHPHPWHFAILPRNFQILLAIFRAFLVLF